MTAKATLTAIVALVGLAGAAPAAQAVSFTLSYFGNVEPGATNNGIFGAGPIAGSPFSLIFTGDTSLPIADDHPDRIRNYGGEVVGGTSVNSAVLTINNVPFGVSGTWFSANNFANNGSTSSIEHISQDQFGRVSVETNVSSNLPEFTFSSFALNPLSSTAIPFGIFRIELGSASAFGELGIDRMTLTVNSSPPSAIPLPAGFPLFASVLGIGILLYRRMTKAPARRA